MAISYHHYILWIVPLFQFLLYHFLYIYFDIMRSSLCPIFLFAPTIPSRFGLTQKCHSSVYFILAVFSFHHASYLLSLPSCLLFLKKKFHIFCKSNTWFLDEILCSCDAYCSDVFHNFIGVFRFIVQYPQISHLNAANKVSIVLQWPCVYSVIGCFSPSVESPFVLLYFCISSSCLLSSKLNSSYSVLCDHIYQYRSSFPLLLFSNNNLLIASWSTSLNLRIHFFALDALAWLCVFKQLFSFLHRSLLPDKKTIFFYMFAQLDTCHVHNIDWFVSYTFYVLVLFCAATGYRIFEPIWWNTVTINCFSFITTVLKKVFSQTFRILSTPGDFYFFALASTVFTSTVVISSEFSYLMSV